MQDTLLGRPALEVAFGPYVELMNGRDESIDSLQQAHRAVRDVIFMPGTIWGVYQPDADNPESFAIVKIIADNMAARLTGEMLWEKVQQLREEGYNVKHVFHQHQV